MARAAGSTPAKRDIVETLEQGDIYFFYRPKVEEEEPESLADVQRAFMVLSSDDEQKYRLIVIGRKKLPDPSEKGKGRYWGFVDNVTKEPDDIREALSGWTRVTKTRGERAQPSSRPAGEGRYRILTHGDHTHLVYSLELPREPGEVQREMQIEDEASYIVTVKNPERPSPRQAGLSPRQKADYPKELRDRFDGKSFVPADPPELLDHEGAELVLMAASDDIQEELGIELDTEAERLESADVFGDLHLDRRQHPSKPLSSGQWD